jgi:hypothetical protein
MDQAWHNDKCCQGLALGHWHRIYRGEQRSPVFNTVVDPLHLIHPTRAARFMVRVQYRRHRYRQLRMTSH